MRSENSEGILTIFLQGDIDAQNAAEIQREMEDLQRSLWRAGDRCDRGLGGGCSDHPALWPQQEEYRSAGKMACQGRQAIFSSSKTYRNATG